MGLLQRLDDLDTRFIGHGDPNWNSPTPKPWTPEMGPLRPVRATYAPYGWTMSAGGVVAYALVIAFPGDRSYLVILLASVWFGFILVAAAVGGARAHVRSLDDLAPLPPDVPIDRSRSRFGSWARATVVSLALLGLPVLGVLVKGDGADFPLASGYLILGGVVCVNRERQIARWEDEHGVEVVRPRWRGGRERFYVCPRVPIGNERVPQP